MSERELRHELEGLQAEARALKDELAAPHAPGFIARRDELKARRAAADVEVSGLEAALREAKAQQAKTLVAVQQAREALRAAEQRRLTWEPWLVLPLVFVAGARALGEDALRLSGGAVAALGLGLLFGDRVLRGLGVKSPTPERQLPSLTDHVFRNTGLGAFTVAVIAVLFGLPLLVMWWSQGRPSTGGLVVPPLAVSLVGVMLAARGAERARVLQRSGWGLSVVSGAACLVLLLTLDALALSEATRVPHFAGEPLAQRVAIVCAVVSAALWVPQAAWWLVDRFWAQARRAAVPAAIACATGALGACIAIVRGGLAPNMASDGLLERFSPLMLGLQLALFGVALGLRGARAPGGRGWLRWVGVAANGLALVALYAALEKVPPAWRPW